MWTRGRPGAALLLVTVCMVRAYPQSLNQNTSGFGEPRQNQQHYANGERTPRSNRNSGPAISHLPPPIQNFAGNQRRQFPGEEFSEPQTPALFRQLGSDNVQQPRHTGHYPEPSTNSRHYPEPSTNSRNYPEPSTNSRNYPEPSTNSRHVLQQQISSRPHNNQQNAHRTPNRSIQTRNKDGSNSNDDQNRIEKPHIAVDTNHERNAPLSRAYLTPPNVRHQGVNTRRFSEQLKMPPQPSQTREQTSRPFHGNNATSVPGQFSQDSFKMARTPQKASGSGEGIVFPDQKLNVPRLGEVGPKCAKGSTFCEDIDGYPKEHISQLIQKESTLYKSLFGSDVLVPEIANRLSPDEELCKYMEHIAYPKVAKNKDEKWAWIANTEDFQQGVRVEVCQSVNSACGFDGFLPVGYTNSCVQKDSGSECLHLGNTQLGYKTECKQKHIYRRLLSVTNDGSPSTDEFLFPSCCVCSVKKVDKK